MIFGKRRHGEKCGIGDTNFCDLCGEAFDEASEIDGVQVTVPREEIDSLSFYSGSFDLCYACAVETKKQITEWLDEYGHHRSS